MDCRRQKIKEEAVDPQEIGKIEIKEEPLPSESDDEEEGDHEFVEVNNFEPECIIGEADEAIDPLSLDVRTNRKATKTSHSKDGSQSSKNGENSKRSRSGGAFVFKATTESTSRQHVSDKNMTGTKGKSRVSNTQVVANKSTKPLPKAAQKRKCNVPLSIMKTRGSSSVPKKSRTSLTIEHKLKVLHECDNRGTVTFAALSKKLNIPKTSIFSIIKNREQIEKIAQSGGTSLNQKKNRGAKFEVLENLLFEYFKEGREKNLRITGPLLVQKAEELALSMGIEDFRASNGWLSNFKRRKNVFVKSHGERNDEDMNVVNEKIVKKNRSDDRHFMDELGLVKKRGERNNMNDLDVVNETNIDKNHPDDRHFMDELGSVEKHVEDCNVQMNVVNETTDKSRPDDNYLMDELGSVEKCEERNNMNDLKETITDKNRPNALGLVEKRGEDCKVDMNIVKEALTDKSCPDDGHFMDELGLVEKPGEDYNVDMNVVHETILNKYHPEDRYNFDEFSLLYNVLPDNMLKMLDAKHHKGKKSKVRATVGLCCNQTGTDKMKPIFISKYEQPKCFKNVKNETQLPVFYHFDLKSWMNSSIFTQVVQRLQRKARREKRKFLLIIDNAPCHELDFSPLDLQNVDIMFLPPNFQPLNKGISQNVKLEYRQRLIQFYLRNIDLEVSMDLMPKWTILHAIKALAEAWDSVSTKTIVDCWHSAGFKPQEVDSSVEDEDHRQGRVATLREEDTTSDAVDDVTCDRRSGRKRFKNKKFFD